MWPKRAPGAARKRDRAKTMKLITRNEAEKCSLEELHGLFRQAFNAVVVAPSGLQERRNALTSLENIECKVLLIGS